MMTQIKLIKIQDEASRVQTFSKIYFCFGNKKGLPEVNVFFCQKFSVRKKYVKQPTFRFDVGILCKSLRYYYQVLLSVFVQICQTQSKVFLDATNS